MRSSLNIIKWNYYLIITIVLVSVFYGSSLNVLGIKKNNKYNSFNHVTNRNRDRDRFIIATYASDINNNNKDTLVTTSASKQPYEFCNKELDSKILKLALPAVLNFAIVPLVGAVDTYWVSIILTLNLLQMLIL